MKYKTEAQQSHASRAATTAIPGKSSSWLTKITRSANLPSKMVRRFDAQIVTIETQLQQLTKEVAERDYTLLQTTPGIGGHPVAQAAVNSRMSA